MKTNCERKSYIAPFIQRVQLDNEISLILQSDVPPGDPEAHNQTEYLNNNPFKNDRA